MKNGIKATWEAMKIERREHLSSFIVYIVLRALVLLVMILQFYQGNYENVFFCILTLFLLILPSFIQVEFKIEIPSSLEILILLFIFAAEILGEIHSFYIVIPMWDTLLHVLNGFLAAAIGFSLVDILNKSEKTHFSLSPIFMALVAFCFSMTIGVVWEFFEFFMDQYMGMDMQKDTIIHAITSVMLDPSKQNIAISISGIDDVMIHGQSLGLGGYLDIGLIDTMEDLLVNFLGAAVFSWFGFFYIKNKGKGRIVNQFIPTIKDKTKDYLERIKNRQKK